MMEDILLLKISSCGEKMSKTKRKIYDLEQQTIVNKKKPYKRKIKHEINLKIKEWNKESEYYE